MCENLVHKIKRKLKKLRLQPIRVYCFHHVCASYDAESMHKCDWMQIDEFKKRVMEMQQSGVEFISLTDAYCHICKDSFRCRKYAVLTFDDGWSSLKEIIPWLVDRNIPVTLFLNPAYIMGAENREIGESITQGKLEQLLKLGKGLITIASHGWNHTLCTDLSMLEFEQSVNNCEVFLSEHGEYIPFFAYPCGVHVKGHNEYLLSKGITPVYMDGTKNYNGINAIHRESLN